VDLMRIDSYNRSLNLESTESDSIEWFVANAYNKSFYYYKSDIPEFFDIFDLITDEIGESCKRFVTSEIHGFTQPKDEISMEFIQDIMINMKMEFLSIEGEHLGCCQNILFTDWWDD
jgi:hypothetical protein